MCIRDRRLFVRTDVVGRIRKEDKLHLSVELFNEIQNVLLTVQYALLYRNNRNKYILRLNMIYSYKKPYGFNKFTKPISVTFFGTKVGTPVRIKCVNVRIYIYVQYMYLCLYNKYICTYYVRMYICVYCGSTGSARLYFLFISVYYIVL